MISIAHIQKEFPQLFTQPKVVYLDSAATTLKPRSVIQRITQFYSFECSNIHRGAHRWADQATEAFENVRKQVAHWIRAKNSTEVIFTKGTTESINLLAQGIKHKMNPGDRFLLSEMEHHSNIVPWQFLAQERGIELVFLPVLKNGEWDLDFLQTQENQKPFSGASLVWCSNALGTMNPIDKVIPWLKKQGAWVHIDAAQAASIREINVQNLGLDFLSFSGHKIFGPSGVGVLYGKEEFLNELAPYQGGGSMIERVTKEKSTYLKAPYRFEAGTPPIASVIGLGAAVEFMNQFSMEEKLQHLGNLLKKLDDQLDLFDSVEKIGVSQTNQNIRSFIVKNVHSSDVGMLLDQENIAVRAGHHCTQPLMDSLGISGTVRVSLSLYNCEEDITLFLNGLKKALNILL